MSRHRLVRLLLVLVAFVSLALLPGSDVRAQVVLRQVYGGNGNVFRQDYVELFNRGGTPVSLAGWSIQYTSATGTGLFSGGAPSALSGSLAPGQSLLVGLAASAAGMPLPEPFVAGNPATNLSTTSGKLALVRSTVGLACNGGSSPCGPAQLDQIVDLVGYGSASFFEGQAAAPAASAATALFRGSGGCLDSFSNASDFAPGLPLPRTAASPLEPCPAGPAVELAVSHGFASELDRSAVVLRVTTDAPVSGPQSVGLAVAGLGLTAQDYTLSDAWLSIADGGTSATASLSVLDDTLAEGTERLSLTLASPSAGLRLGGSIHASIVLADDDDCGEPAVAIHAIQGSGADSPQVGLATEVEAIVTGRFLGTPGDSLQGFFLQEEDVDVDGDSTTSEGLFVYEAGSGLAAGIAVGDRVRVGGTVRERSGATALEALAEVGLCTHGEAMPTAARPIVPIPGVPSDDLAAARTAIEAYAERFESMRVEFPMPLAVGEAFDLARLGQLSLHEGERIRTFTDTNRPSVAGQLAHRIDGARRRVLLDDGDESLDGALENGRPLPHPQPGLSLSNRFRAGDRILGLTGVLDRSTRDRGVDEPFRIRPVAEDPPFIFVAANPPPAAPPEVGGRLVIASFNVANYFATIDSSASSSAGSCGPAGVLDCRGADSAAEFERQTDKLRAAICALAPDVLALMEIENDEGATGEGLARALDAVPGCGAWTALATGSIGSDAIRVALLFRPAAIVPVGSPRILDASVDPRFLDGRNRPVLAQTLREVATGETFTLAVAHLKSKGSPCSGPGDVDLGDGQGHCNATRTAGARALVDWLASDPTASGDPDFLIVGDLNSYRREDPVEALADGADDAPGTADDFIDLVFAFAGPSAYSYLFDGQLGRLDHAFASASLAAKITGAAEWHVNADEPPAFDYDDAVADPGEAGFEAKPDALPLFAADARRTSDHDPLLIGLPETDTTVLVAAGGIAAFALARGRARRGLWRRSPPLYIPANERNEQGESDACDREGDDVGVGPVGRGSRFGRGARQSVAGRDEHGDAGHEDAGPEPADLYAGEYGGTRGPVRERREVHDVERSPVAGQVQLGRDLPGRQRDRRDGLPGPRRLHLDDDHDDRWADHEDGGPGQAGR